MSRYSLYVETYLPATWPDLDLRVMKIQRWCGGTADNYADETLEQELILAKPNIFTICFGMNDGGGREFTADTGRRYETALTRIVERNKQNITRRPPPSFPAARRRRGCARANALGTCCIRHDGG